MLEFDWPEQTVKIGTVFSIVPCENDFAEATRLLWNIFLNFVSNLILGGGNWVLCLRHQHNTRMDYCKCTILLDIHANIYLVITLVVLHIVR